MDPGPGHDASPTLDAQELLLLADGVRLMALRSLGDADAAADVVQETLARVLQAVSEGRPRDRAAMGAFVRAIARHVITDEIRNRRRVVRLGPQGGADHAPEPADEHDPLDALVRDEDIAAMRRALRTLSTADRRVIHLSFVDGLTPSAVAERLREPRARVRKRKSRALERLREAFLGGRAGIATGGGHETATTPTLPIAGGMRAADDEERFIAR
ncbi:MAG: RNA polymerase sigma factor [Gemmatimonadaceae bacterium]